MKNNHNTTYTIVLVILDCLALIIAFAAAYFLRDAFVHRPIQFGSGGWDFMGTVFYLLPLWVTMFFSLRLYDRQIYTDPVRYTKRLLLASVCGVMMMISVSFFTDIVLFPAKLIPIYAAIISFAVLILFRAVANITKSYLLKHGIGVSHLLIVGDNSAVNRLAKFIDQNPASGFKIEAIVTKSKLLSKRFKHLRRSSMETALRCCKIDSIIQTDDKDSRENYLLASERFVDYYYLPAVSDVANLKHSVEFINQSPIILVHPTPLLGIGRFYKRVFDIIGSLIGIVLASPIMLIVAIAVKIDDPKGSIFMRGEQQKRLTRYNEIFKVYKFRSHFAKFDGRTDEEVFKMVGKPELIKEYRANGDKLENDFRVTKVGKVIRRWSLDELPQLFNVLKGDMSLVGPRPLVAQEINRFEKKSAITSIKSGLTGLAVVSGRRDISFEERRELDIYYAQNWSFWLDISILFRTLIVAIKGS